MFLTRVSCMASSSLRALISCSYCFIRSWEEMGGRLRRIEGERRSKRGLATLLPVRHVHMVSYLGVVEYVLHRFIGDTHHPSGKPQCGDLRERHQYATVQQHTANVHRSFPPPFLPPLSSLSLQSVQPLPRCWQS